VNIHGLKPELGLVGSQARRKSPSRFAVSAGRAVGRDEPVGDRRPGHEYRVTSRFEHLQRAFQVRQPVRNANGIRMECNGHHSRILGKLALEGSNGVRDPMENFVSRMLLDGIDDRVVKLDRIRHGDERSLRGQHPTGKIVEDPVGNVLDPRLLKMLGGILGLVQAGAEPAARWVSDET